jgi:pathogenesis-related protein 1
MRFSSSCKRLLLVFGLIPVFSTEAALVVDTHRMVAAHNRERAVVDVPPLSYSFQLAASAQAWAESLKQSNHCRMRHSATQGQYGENLFWASGVRWSNGVLEVQTIGPEQVVDAWARERANYDHASNSCASGKVCGHYTQVVWADTTTVGCGTVVCEDTREQIWVCHYQPAGNWIGRAPY